MTKRKNMMAQLKHQAKEYDRIGDVTLRRQCAQSWLELATESEARKAPAYLTWHGRKQN